MPEMNEGLWIAGWITGGVVVVLVAVLALTLIRLAASIRSKVDDALGSLERARDATAAMWGLKGTNAALADLLHRTKEAGR